MYIAYSLAAKIPSISVTMTPECVPGYDAFSMSNMHSQRLDEQCDPSDQHRLGLLTLPVEARLLILHELLCSKGPLSFFGRNDKDYVQPIWPQVLQTCRNLYDEGKAILYSNTIQGRVHILYAFCDAELLSSRFTYSWRQERVARSIDTPMTLLKNMRKINISIRTACRNKEDEAACDRSYMDQKISRGVQNFALLLQNWPNLKDVEIDFDHTHPHHGPSEWHGKLLGGFSNVRHRSCVIVRGTSAELAQETTDTMTSKDPAYMIDLNDLAETWHDYSVLLKQCVYHARFKIYTARSSRTTKLLEWMEWWEGELERARQKWNVQYFLRARSKLIGIYGYLMEKKGYCRCRNFPRRFRTYVDQWELWLRERDRYVGFAELFENAEG